MTSGRTRARLLSAATLICATAACGEEGASVSSRWAEPAAHTYTLTSSEGERSLIDTFKVTVEDGEVTEAVGLDDSAERVVRDTPEDVPTLGELLAELEQARQDGADTAEAEYAADGHPVRIDLDRDEDAIDDEARYVIEDYAVTD